MLQSWNSTIHCQLNILRQRRTHAPDIHFICMQSFRFYKYLMSLFICELNNLIFYRWAISWTCSLNNTRINRRSVQIITDDLMRLFICVGQPAGSLFNLYILRISRERKRHNSFIAKLLFHLTEINRTLIHSGWCTSLETTHFHTQTL